MVASLPRTGASSVATMASAARTFSLSSSVSVVTRLTSLCATLTLVPSSSASSFSAPSSPGGPPSIFTKASHRATSARLSAAAVLTSASGSCSSFSYAGTRMSMAPGSEEKDPTTSLNFDAAVHRTRHDRSSIVDTTSGRTLSMRMDVPDTLASSPCSDVMALPRATQFSVICNLTESYVLFGRGVMCRNDAG